jgi:hypothetical protein
MWIFFFVNLAAASPWLRRSWSPKYSVLVLLILLILTIHFFRIAPSGRSLFYQMRRSRIWSTDAEFLLRQPILVVSSFFEFFFVSGQFTFLFFFPRGDKIFNNFLTTFWQLFDNFFDNFLTTFWQLFDYFLTAFWQFFDNFATTFWQLFHNFWTTFLTTFVTTFVTSFAKFLIFFILMVVASCRNKYYGTNFIYAVPTSLLIAPGLRTIQFLFDNFLTTFWQLFGNFLPFLQIFRVFGFEFLVVFFGFCLDNSLFLDNFLSTFCDNFYKTLWQLFGILLTYFYPFFWQLFFDFFFSFCMSNFDLDF